MKKADRNALIALPIVILIGLGFALAGSQGGASVSGIPLFAFSVGLAFLIQWLAFIPAYQLQTEKFFDLTGSITYISVTILAVLLSPEVDARSILLRDFPGAILLEDPASEKVVLETLQGASPAASRLWYVHYPECDPHGQIDFVLRTRCLTLVQREHETTSLRLVDLRTASWDTPGHEGGAGASFGESVSLIHYTLVSRDVEFRTSVGVWRSEERL